MNKLECIRSSHISLSVDAKTSSVFFSYFIRILLSSQFDPVRVHSQHFFFSLECYFSFVKAHGFHAYGRITRCMYHDTCSLHRVLRSRMFNAHVAVDMHNTIQAAWINLHGDCFVFFFFCHVSVLDAIRVLKISFRIAMRLCRAMAN